MVVNIVIAGRPFHFLKAIHIVTFELNEMARARARILDFNGQSTPKRKETDSNHVWKLTFFLAVS